MGSSIHLIPEDIVDTKILTQLPVKSILRFRSVCKKWRYLFSTPEFIRSHMDRNPRFDSLLIYAKQVNHPKWRKHWEEVSMVSGDGIRFQNTPKIILKQPLYIGSWNTPIRIVGSINGLVCISQWDSGSYTINITLWNPATKLYKTIPPIVNREPELPHTGEASLHGYSLGFGFDRLENDYKIIHINTCLEEYPGGNTVYSCATDSWDEEDIIAGSHLLRNKDYFSKPLGQTCFAIINGCPYWLDVDSAYVVKYEFQSKELKCMPKLDVQPDHEKTSYMNLKDSLNAVVYTTSEFSVFRLDEGHGVWSNIYTVVAPNFLVNCRQIFSINGSDIFYEDDDRSLFSYDPKTNKKKRIFDGKIHHTHASFCYKMSLLFLDGMKPHALLSGKSGATFTNWEPRDWRRQNPEISDDEYEALDTQDDMDKEADSAEEESVDGVEVDEME